MGILGRNPGTCREGPGSKIVGFHPDTLDWDLASGFSHPLDRVGGSDWIIQHEARIGQIRWLRESSSPYFRLQFLLDACPLCLPVCSLERPSKLTKEVTAPGRLLETVAFACLACFLVAHIRCYRSNGFLTDPSWCLDFGRTGILAD
ncbi:hypothetical protein SAMD00023353_7500050 [Rosellinia necatrix]|uniref:Uncharacterized protein n=1 Tax=Rosellinia necatrix TaxID=77044 RepID=A0A1S8AB46_ROSNE|nr:hypothetical protein SAMD00023353_7500050 [Rosellinia necatrix]